ncbi:hypothetical protein TIFTF001_003645 [Ficus carica]|uniref:Major facilitator superfamily (MFS) profile domain-containing protein n=1 Tax=Ficus carica TaxID=3494 RepID=A0AA87ZGP5_FICCA|nr:hypothetical protein TIFTF001_003645 [Ficus carica]
MAGAVIDSGRGKGKKYPGKLTARVLWTCLVAACGGLIFGYDLGISGGVTSMDSFLKQFFPAVYAKESSLTPSDSQYCKYDSQTQTLFTSSLYLAALISSVEASTITRAFGRRITMLWGRILFLCGALVNAFAQNLWMLNVGRILLGFGVGCANQSVPIYVSEMALYKYRGALNMLFQLTITIRIVVANILNYFFAKIEEQGKHDEAKEQLLRIRGVSDVDEEFNDLIAASEASKLVKHQWRALLARKNRPQLFFAVGIPAFQQLTGMNVITFYAPVLFRTIGFRSNASLMSSMITGAVNSLAISVSIFTVDKVGRRKLFLEGGIQMFICQVVITIAIAAKFGVSGNPGVLPKWYAYGLVFFIRVYVAGFAWSWGPLGWLVPSEIFPLEVSSAAQSVNVSVNMIFTFAIAQVFTTMLCHMKFELFIFFAIFVVIMSVFIYALLQETKGVPIEEMGVVWRNHPYWRNYVDAQDQDQELQKV